MANLNWRQQKLEQEMSAPAVGTGLLTLTLDSALGGLLAQALAEVFAEGASPSELRVDLPKGWILFWKPRSGESRQLLSHPGKDEYVATAALVAEHGRRFATRLASLGVGETVTVAAVAEDTVLANLNNVDIAIRLA